MLHIIATLGMIPVLASARGGIGTRLVEGVLDWCRANQIDRVVLWPTKRSVTLYMRYGFAQDADVMELKIRS